MDSHAQIADGLEFTYAELLEAVKDKRVTRRGNMDGTLSIFNYTDEIQYLNKWDEITLACRGLILNSEGKVVARPWKKFFNLGQVNLPIQFDTAVEVMDKADGSLGILYPEPSTNACIGFGPNSPRWKIATRGSFDSKQAWHATRLFDKKYADSEMLALVKSSNWTFLFEIIYPSNRIVLNYHGMDDLMLLGAVDNLTGYYYGPREAKACIGWPGPIVETYEYNTLSDAIANMGRDNKEGYVVRSHNFMVKIKEPDYLDLHKLVTNLSPKTVWSKLMDGRTPTDIISSFPDEFHDDVKSYLNPLLDAYSQRSIEIQRGFESVVDSYLSDGRAFDRGEFARSISKSKDKGYYFTLLDGHSIRDSLWKELKPREEPVERS